MSQLFNIIKNINSVIWSWPMLILLFGTHLFFTFYLKFIQKNIGKGIKLSIAPSQSGEGDTSSFATLTTTWQLPLELVIL
ncbi:hypothetical protein [Anaerocolumna aminovalerica]|uniref:hypothetical protein n=1 Tax=Anaerocolumna aminovalerica TaxID=1527 RepID=UPI00248AE596|nr:hypothetical protein [Anaerocolumna aminovalerica]